MHYLKAVLDADVPRCHVDQHLGDKERADGLVALLCKRHARARDLVQVADAAADGHALWTIRRLSSKN